MPSVSKQNLAVRYTSVVVRSALACAIVAFALAGAGCGGADLGTGVIPGDSTVNGGGNSGGGGGGGTTVVPAQTIDAFGQAVVDEVNKERRKVGLDTLAVDGRLVAAAQLQANQIVQTGVVDHVIAGTKYPTLASRIDATGFAWSASAEDLGQGYSTAKTLVAAWMATPADRANVLSASLTRAGVAEGWTLSGVQYSVMVLATPQ